jgi:hypothetical protein
MYDAIRKGPRGSVSAPPQALRILDDEAIEALAVVLPRVNALKGSDRSRTGLVLINAAAIIDHPAISRMMNFNLTQGTDRLSWMGIAGTVVSMRGADPALRATLEKIAAEDVRPELRQEAQRILELPEPAARIPAAKP